MASSAGDYPRRISQQAVQNLSALGGAGATAALQRSLLRFFETFRYRRLGLTCELRDSICRMGGVTPARAAESASARAGGYVIVEPGFPLRDFTVSLHWSRRFDADPGNRWLRGVIAEVGRSIAPRNARPATH